jgi:hypothetical protein
MVETRTVHTSWLTTVLTLTQQNPWWKRAPYILQRLACRQSGIKWNTVWLVLCKGLIVLAVFAGLRYYHDLGLRIWYANVCAGARGGG